MSFVCGQERYIRNSTSDREHLEEENLRDKAVFSRYVLS